MPTAQPAKLLLLKGKAPGHDSAGRPVPEPPAFDRGAPEPPDDLSDEARKEWDRIVPGLDRLDLLKAEDLAALVEHCETWSSWKDANMLVREEGLIVVNKDSGMPHKNPAVQVMLDMGARLLASANHFGLTPAAERKLGHFPKTDDTTEDPYGDQAETGT